MTQYPGCGGKKTKDPNDCYYCDMPAKVDALTLGGRRRLWRKLRQNECQRFNGLKEKDIAFDEELLRLVTQWLRPKKTNDPNDWYCDMPAKVEALTRGGRRRMCNFTG